MIPLLHKFPVDWTGTSLNNRTKSEFHDLSALYDLAYRCVVLDNGYFYTDNLYIHDGAGVELKPDVDYQLVSFNDDIAVKTGKDACAVIVILNRSIGNKIYVDAQMVGGPYSTVGKAIAEMAMGLLNNSRKVHWNNITGKPDDFAAGGHTHPLWQLYGFTPSVVQFKRMAAGLGKKAGKVFDGIYRDFDDKMKIIEKELEAAEAVLTTHIADLQNPHEDTAFKIGLGNVLNASTATESEARQPHGNIMNVYATPWSMGLAMDANFTPILNAHITNRNNPHGLTAAQLSVYTVSQMNDIARLYTNLNATMDKTARVYGYTPVELEPRIRENNDVSNITIGMYPKPTYDLDYPNSPAPTDRVFMPDGHYQLISAVIEKNVRKSTAVYSIVGNSGNPTNAVNTANRLYPTAKAGSMLFYQYTTTAASYTGNGAVMYATTRSSMVLRKPTDAGGWAT